VTGSSTICHAECEIIKTLAWITVWNFIFTFYDLNKAIKYITSRVNETTDK